MQPVRSLCEHVPDERAAFDPLVRLLLEALGLTACGVLLDHDAPAHTVRWDAGRGVRGSLVRRRNAPDPHAGGCVDARELFLERDDGTARIALEEIAWVGHELHVYVRGLGGDGEAIERLARAWLAAAGGAEPRRA